MEYSQEDFIKFKEMLISISKSEYGACESFLSRIEETEELSDITHIFEIFADDINRKLGGYDYSDEIDDLKYDIKQLESEIEDLEFQLRDKLVMDTLYDEMKLNIFSEFHSKYSPWEFEELLKNGKLLNMSET